MEGVCTNVNTMILGGVPRAKCLHKIGVGSELEKNKKRGTIGSQIRVGVGKEVKEGEGNSWDGWGLKKLGVVSLFTLIKSS